MSGPQFPSNLPNANVHPGVAFGRMLDVKMDLPNLSRDMMEGPYGPYSVEPGTSQRNVTNKLRIDSLRDGNQIKYKKGGAIFHYRGRDASSGTRGRYLALSIQNLNEAMALTAQRELLRFGGLVTRAEPEWNEQLYELLYDPAGTLLPLGSMWTNDEPPEFFQREVTLCNAGDATLVPNVWSITQGTCQFVGFAIKRMQRSFTISADGERIELVGSVRASVGGRDVLIQNYVPQIVPIIEEGNCGPLYFNGDLDDVAEPGSPRWNRELVYRAPRVFQRPPTEESAGRAGHLGAVADYCKTNGGATVRAGVHRDHQQPPDDNADFEDMALHVAPYFRFGQVIQIEKALMDPVQIWGRDPVTALEKAVCSYPDDIKLRKASHLTISLSQNPAYSWRK